MCKCKCSGEIKFIIFAACSILSTKIITPLLFKLFSIIFFFGRSFLIFVIEFITFDEKFLLSVIKMDCAFSSCSAWAIKSDATQSGSFLLLATTIISDGPASRSIPTFPYNCFFASAT